MMFLIVILFFFETVYQILNCETAKLVRQLSFINNMYIELTWRKKTV